MTSQDNAMRTFSTRLSEAYMAKLDALQERLQARYGPRVRVTYRMVIEEAVDTLEKRLDELERKR